MLAIRILKQQHFAALLIQQKWCSVIRKNVAARMDHPIITLQFLVRRFIYERKESAAVKIQKIARTFLVSLTLNRNHNAACIIQCKWFSVANSFLRTRLEKEAKLIAIEESKIISKAKREAQVLVDSLLRQIVCLQSWARHMQARNIKKRRQKAIIKIQAFVRLSLAVIFLRKQQEAACIIQCKWFSVADSFANERQKREAIFIAAEESRILIVAEEQARVILNSLNFSALQIQSCVRCFQSKSLYKKKKEAILKLQGFARFVHVKCLLNRQHEAASKIQTRWFLFAALLDKKRLNEEADLIAKEEARILAAAELLAMEDVRLMTKELSFPLFSQGIHSFAQMNLDFSTSSDGYLNSQGSCTANSWHVTIAQDAQPLPKYIQIKSSVLRKIDKRELGTFDEGNNAE